jgi:quinohemoprotein ethanol dehydrogenase
MPNFDTLFHRSATALLVALFHCACIHAEPVTQQRLVDAAQDGANWLSHGRDYDETRFSPLARIDRGNVAQLGLAWSFDMETRRGLEATPLVIDGTMYVSGAWSTVYALDARNGRLLWKFDPQVPRNVGWKSCCDVVNRGVAAWGDRIFVGTIDGRLIALDAATGDKIWDVQTTDPAKVQSITGAPRVIDGKVIIGNSGAEFGVRGYVSAFDAGTGVQLWRFYTVPGNPADGFEDDAQVLAARTWTGEWWKHGGGGTVWDSMAYDARSNLLYIGVGNGSPHNRRLRSPEGGDNLFLSSIVALDASTGKYVWHFQETPAESWDYTATQQITIADIEWEGASRRVLLHAPKNGFFFVIDAASGKLLSARKYVPTTWATGYDLATGRPHEVAGQDYRSEVTFYPSGLGGHNWQSMAYSPVTGLVYIPAQHFGMRVAGRERMPYFPRSYNMGYGGEPPPDNYLFTQALLKSLQKGYLKAWDPRTQQEKWRVEYPYLGNGGALATAGGLVFQGEIRGIFHAYAADTGAELWRAEVPNSIVAAPITYSVDGEQYVAILSGSGGATLMTWGIQLDRNNVNGHLLVFKLGGQAMLPVPSPPAPIPEPPPRMPIDAQGIARAKGLYMDHCMRCHGLNAVSNGQVPDLRRLEPVWHEHFDRIVRDGMMADAGMPPFGDVISASESKEIHAWLIELAWQDKEVREAPAWWTRLRSWFYERVAALLAWSMQRDLPAESAAEKI